MSLNVAILGCGPAGLLAAHACARANANFQIFSVKKKSPIHGAQYMHMAVPGIHSPAQPDGMIAYAKAGSRDGYARKVYGNPDAPVSWDKFDIGLYPAWSMQKTYDFLWDEFEKDIQQKNITPKWVENTVEMTDLVICAIPATVACKVQNHRFHQTSVWIRDGAPSEDEHLDNNCIVYNGDPQVPWYRASNLFGHESVEFGHTVNHARRGMKPTGTDCDCHGEALLRVGRFGRWERGVLAHDGFTRVQQTLEHYHDHQWI